LTSAEEGAGRLRATGLNHDESGASIAGLVLMGYAGLGVGLNGGPRPAGPIDAWWIGVNI
jgi:hypothetical protein